MVKTQSTTTKTEIVISARTFFKTVLLVIGTVILLAAIRQMSHALVILFTAFFFALALNAPVSFFARYLPGRFKGSRTLGTTIAFLLIVLLLGGFIASLIPSLVQQAQNLANSAPGFVSDIRNQNGAIGELITKYKLQDQVTEITNDLSGRFKSSTGQAFTTIQSLGNSVFTSLTILVLTFMMLIEGPRWFKFMHELVPSKHKELAASITGDMYKVVKGYVNGQVILAALAAIVITPIFIIMGVSNPIGLTVIVFIAGLIPMVGHTIGAFIVSIVALFTSPTAAAVVLVYYLLYQQLENIFIQPKIQANSTDMSPLLVFGSVIVGISFSGLLGGLVAIPIAGCIRIALLEYIRSTRGAEMPIIKSELKSATGKTK